MFVGQSGKRKRKSQDFPSSFRRLCRKKLALLNAETFLKLGEGKGKNLKMQVFTDFVFFKTLNKRTILVILQDKKLSILT